VQSMFFSIRQRFTRTPSWLHDAPECRMHVHSDQHERHIDYAICHEVQSLDCYRVRQLTSAGFAPRIIVDIGAHIGSFTALAAKYFPDARIYSFEPLRRHYDLLVRNFPPRRGRPQNLAVLGFYGNEEGHDLYPGNEFERAYRARQMSNAISVSQLLRKYKLPHIDFLKIDCEQSEVNIFRELDHLDRLKDIDVIAGEWHFEIAKNELRSLVGKTHEVELVDDGLWNYFFARRRREAV
jgi:FkbM family methyltransferase